MKFDSQAYAKQANKKRREIDFDTNDYVWVTTKHWQTLQPSAKLSDQNAGPFKILERRGNSFVLDLPPSMKVHNVFNAEKLRKAATDPLPGQANPEPPSIQIDGQDEWELDHIVNVRLKRNKLYYIVDWKGHDKDLQEYPANFLRNAPLALQAFHNQHPDKPGPPVNLSYWLHAALHDETPSARPDDDTPASISRPRRTSPVLLVRPVFRHFVRTRPWSVLSRFPHHQIRE